MYMYLKVPGCVCIGELFWELFWIMQISSSSVAVDTSQHYFFYTAY